VPIPVPEGVSEEEVQEAANAAEEVLPEDAEAVVGDRDPEPDADGNGTDPQRTIEQLRSTGDPNEVERTPVLESGNIDVAPDEWQLGFPLQGIPRIAAVLNLNYLYNEDRERWERQTPQEDTSVDQDVVKLAERDMAGKQSVNFIDDVSTEFSEYRIRFDNYDVDGAFVMLWQVSTDNGNTFENTAADYSSNAGVAVSQGVVVANGLREDSVAQYTVYRPTQADAQTYIQGQIGAGDINEHDNVAARFEPDAGVDAWRFRAFDEVDDQLTTFVDGTATLYGFR